MTKIKTLIKAPLLVQSGYSVHSRQIFRALISDPLFDVHVESLQWGNCPFLTEDTDEKNAIKQCVKKHAFAKHNKQDQYDLFVHVTIPNEFEQLGKINIGVTAGIETDRISPQWAAKCNEMDLIVVPSEHSRKVIDATCIDWQDPNTGKTGSFKVTTPIIICHEGVDTEVYKKLDKLHDNKIADLELEPDFCFLSVGQWGKGGFGEDRKNIALLVRYFIETFKGRKDVGLVLKTNMSRNNVSDYEMVQNRLKEIKLNFKEEEVPPIYLVHGNLSHEEMVNLYNHPKIKAFASITHGEGFGLPLLEAAACELPIIATNWSGHLDFLKRGKFSAIEYDMKEIPDIAVWDPILIKGSRWAEVKEEDVKKRLKKMVSSYTVPKTWAKELVTDIQSDFNLQVVCQQFNDVVKQTILVNQERKGVANPIEVLQSAVDTLDDYNILYTMPMSHGDVFISTAVIDGVMKEVREVQPNAKLYFATSEQYYPILEDNPNVYKCIPWREFMMNMDITEQIFDLVLTPNVATQYTFSNWVRKGQGRLLAEEFANHCQTKLGDYFIKTDPCIDMMVEKYMTIHTGTGKGQWEARNYQDWPEVIANLKSQFPDLNVIQVGSADEPLLDVDMDLRGKTSVHQLASVIQGSSLHVSIDTFTMHMAAAYDVPLVSIFGCSHATSTGPWVKDKQKARFILLESERRTCGCQKACYKNKPVQGAGFGPINEIDPKLVVQASAEFLRQEEFKYEEQEYERITEKISGYTTTYNIKGYPFVESIKSMLGFCDEVVIVDGCSDDGTYEVLEELAAADDRIQLYQNPWDFEEPGMDGMQKAFARALCSSPFLWQQDCDEVVHEKDYKKIKLITKRFPVEVDILHLPIAELWGNGQTATGRRHSWKWRMSRNKPEITHGINKHSRLTNETTGKVYAKQGGSDGCEYVHAMNYEMLPHTGFYLQNRQIEMARISDPEMYGQVMNQIFEQVPSVYHYSWASLPRKIKNFTEKWNKQWNALYQTDNVQRFPGIDTDEQITELSKQLYEAGGEKEDQIKYKFELMKKGPAIMENWLKENV